MSTLVKVEDELDEAVWAQADGYSSLSSFITSRKAEQLEQHIAQDFLPVASWESSHCSKQHSSK